MQAIHYRRPLLVAILMALGTPAYAQDAEDNSEQETGSWLVETIVVTGERGGYSATSTTSATRTNAPLI